MGFRRIEHALGESCIPERPARVVPLDIAIAEVMVILGERPAVKSQVALDFIIARMHPEVLEDFEALYGDVPDVGFPINLEVIVEVNPDLIVAPSGFVTDSLYEQLTQIAPTVVFDLEPGDWRGRVLFAGEALNRQDEVEGLLAVVDERSAELQTALGETMQETEVSLVRVFTNQIGILIAGSTGDHLLRELGFARPQAQAAYDLAFVLDDNNGRAELPLQREKYSWQMAMLSSCSDSRKSCAMIPCGRACLLWKRDKYTKLATTGTAMGCCPFTICWMTSSPIWLGVSQRSSIPIAKGCHSSHE
jgi:ABC-type Fe3+-citrate transport system substrate-binding protein